MSGPEAVSGTAPGRAAYEAYTAATGPRLAWDRLADRHREAWDAAARAAIAHTEFALTAEVTALRRQLDAACNDRGVFLRERDALRALLNEAGIAEPYEPGSVSIGEGTVWEDVKPAPELAAAMAETRQLRDLVREILATFGTPAKPGTVRWTAKQVAGWRERAGLEG